MDNTSNRPMTRAEIAAAYDKALDAFLAASLDARGEEQSAGPLSADRYAELDALQTEVNRLAQQLRDIDVATQATTITPGAYNGYANGETYAIVRNISSSASASEIAAALVAGAWSAAADRIAEDRAAIVAPRADAADALREWLEEENPLADAGGLFNDLVSHALARVDWGDIADHFAPNPLPSIEPLPAESAEEGD